MVFHWSLSHSKSSQDSRTLLTLLDCLNSAEVWMVSTSPLISNFSRPFISPLVTVLITPITIVITVSCIFHSFFFQFPSKVQVLIFLFALFLYYSVACRDGKVQISASSFFTSTKSGRMAEIRWSVCFSKSLRTFLLYSFCANSLNSLIMWLTVSSLSPHNLHLLFCSVLSILIYFYSLRVFHISVSW